MVGHKILVPLLEGFEEIEAITIVDVLRRAGLPVVIGGDIIGPVVGSHGIRVEAEVELGRIEPGWLRAIVLPGGMPGSSNLAKHEVVLQLLKQVAAAGGYTCAICAAPIALASAGVHAGKTVTSYPGFQGLLGGADYAEDRVVVDGKVITSRGPGTALEFSLTLVGVLAGEETEAKLQDGMLAHRVGPARRVS